MEKLRLKDDFRKRGKRRNRANENVFLLMCRPNDRHWDMDVKT